MSDTNNFDYLPHTTFCFYLIDSQMNTDPLPNFAFFPIKSPSVTQRKVSEENAFLKRVSSVAFFFLQNYRFK